MMRSKSVSHFSMFVLSVLCVPFVLNTARAENVKVGIPSLTVTMLPLPVAKDRGFFQQEGLNVDELVGKIYDYHKRAETLDGRVDPGLAADTIRDSLQAEAITKEVPVNQVFDF